MKNLIVGYTFKNCKELGRWLGKDIPDKLQTNVKKSWLKEFDTYCTWHKDGQKIIVDEVFDTQLEKVDGRRGNTRKRSIKSINKYKAIMHENAPEFLIPYDIRYRSGIYKIQLGNDIYIGSTVNLYKRFTSHRTNEGGNHSKTFQLLEKGATFELIQLYEDINLMRIMEIKYIEYYEKSNEYNCINSRKDYSESKTLKKLLKTNGINHTFYNLETNAIKQ